MLLNFSNKLQKLRLRRCLNEIKQLKLLSNKARSIENFNIEQLKEKFKNGPNLIEFINGVKLNKQTVIAKRDDKLVPYLSENDLGGNHFNVYIETYGCQMNVNDTDIVKEILLKHNYNLTNDLNNADIIFLMTCAIREKAEQKIWNRLRELAFLRKKSNGKIKKIGLLGCMAERLKTKLLEKDELVDMIAGPDSYRDLPRLLSITRLTDFNAVNVLLSIEETYADIMPTIVSRREDNGEKSCIAFVSIMRGCDNMCTFCIVPFTRGRERSREANSIVEEINLLSKSGIKEVTLLGQNVNSYCDISTECDQQQTDALVHGFKSVCKPKKGGLRFSKLLERIAKIDDEMRIRFTSPHPKDFPPQVIDVIKNNHNICNSIHLPAQSGSNQILERMRRGYTKEAYLNLVESIRKTIPDIAISSDFISGFCGESDDDHLETLDLLEKVKYNYIFAFPYSMREKTRAHYKMTDDVASKVKNERVKQVIEVFRRNALKLHQSMIGNVQLVLVECNSKRSSQFLSARNDYNTKVIIPQLKLYSDIEDESEKREMRPGDYILVEITDCNSQTLFAKPIKRTKLNFK